MKLSVTSIGWVLGMIMMGTSDGFQNIPPSYISTAAGLPVATLKFKSKHISHTSTSSSTVLSVASNLDADKTAPTRRLFGGSETTKPKQELSKLTSKLSQIGMMAFILGMCLALPFTLIPQQLLYRMKIIDRITKERLAVSTGQFCARWLMRVIPFCSVKVTGSSCDETDPPPSVWVCNHTSMLDVFLLLATDRKLRGRKKRPIKIVYWQDLEKNPVTKILFRQAGFIPVQMADNGSGEANDYDKSSFRKLLKDCKQAFAEGFDIGILPEGQLNPNPEAGLLPIFTGAFTLAKLSKRPIRMMALHGAHRLWHPDDAIGMTVTGRDVAVRCYGHASYFKSADEFKAAFERVVGHFGATGIDLEQNELDRLLMVGK